MNAHDPIYLTRQQVRSVDRTATGRYHIPSIVLMENAARQLADHAQSMLAANTRALCLVGPGNNGGDALAAARHLHLRGYNVTCHTTRPHDQCAGDAKTNLDIAISLDIPFTDDPTAVETDLLIDGLLGTGLTQPVRPDLLPLIEWINKQPAPVLAVDIPSGLNCDTGLPLGAAVRATQTITFVAQKLGFKNPDALQYTGPVHVADIGAPWQHVLKANPD